MPGARLFAFVDWDDTLKVTNALYDAASRENARLVLRHLPMAGVTSAELHARVHDIDLRKAHSRGLRPENFSEAWVEGYCELAEQCGVVPSPAVAAEVRRRAARVPDEPQPDYPGASELLQALRELGCEITIWTAGDPTIQRAKVERSGYRPLVDRVCAVPDKNPEALRQALGKREPGRACVIGNSPRSDILPALELGIWAVHVRQDVWAYDAVSVDTRHQRYVGVHSIREVPGVVRRVFSDVLTA